MEYYAAERKKELPPFMAAWMELENIMLNEISQVVNTHYNVQMMCYRIVLLKPV